MSGLFGHVESIHRAQCFTCGWEGDERSFRDDAEADANDHDEASHDPSP